MNYEGDDAGNEKDEKMDVQLMFPVDREYMRMMDERPDNDDEIAFSIAKATGVSASEARIMESICSEVEKSRMEEDFVYRIVLGEYTPEIRKWGEYMARCLLRLLRCPSPEYTQATVAVELCSCLYGIDSVGDISALPEEVALGSLEDWQMLWTSLGAALIHILMFVQNAQTGTMRGWNAEDFEARKAVARKALFFLVIYYDLGFTKAVIRSAKTLRFFNARDFQYFVVADLHLPIQLYLNGQLQDTLLFVTQCFSNYMIRVIPNPFGGSSDGDLLAPMPFYTDQWEQIRKEREHKKHGGAEDGDASEDKREGYGAGPGHLDRCAQRLLKKQRFET
jgi:hypothetical protein